MPGRWAPRKSVRRRVGGLVAVERPLRGRRRLAADVLGGLRTRLAIRREAVEARVVHPDPDRETVRREGRRDPGDAKYVTCSFVIVSGSRRSKSRSSSFVHASAATTTCPARWTVPSAVVDLDPAAGVPQTASPGSGRGAWPRSRGRGAGGRRCRGSGRRGRTPPGRARDARRRAATAASAGMISGAVEVLVRDALRIHRPRCSRPAGSARRAGRRRGRRSWSRSSSPDSASTSAHVA